MQEWKRAQAEQRRLDRAFRRGSRGSVIPTTARDDVFLQAFYSGFGRPQTAEAEINTDPVSQTTGYGPAHEEAFGRNEVAYIERFTDPLNAGYKAAFRNRMTLPRLMEPSTAAVEAARQIREDRIAAAAALPLLPPPPVAPVARPPNPRGFGDRYPVRLRRPPGEFWKAKM